MFGWMFKAWFDHSETLLGEECPNITLQSNILCKNIYECLNEEQRDHVYKVVNEYLNSSIAYNKQSIFNFFEIKAIYHRRDELQVLIARSQERLNSPEFDPVLFKFLSDEEKLKRAQTLYFMYFVINAQYALDVAEGRTVNYPSFAAELNQCVLLISALKNTTTDISSDSPLKKYLNISILAPILDEIMAGITCGENISALTFLNNIRLYWVWSKAAVDSFLQAFLKESARDLLNLPAPLTGGASFGIYGVRGGFEVGKVGKHVFFPTEQEKKISWYQRLVRQAQQRKFKILNDIIWGVANLACFLWLVASISYWGDFLTTVLLIMDLSLAYWELLENKKKHDGNLLRIDHEILRLQDNAEANKASIDALKLEKVRAIKKWDNDLTLLNYNVYYAVGLLVAFAIMCAVIFPPAAALPAGAAVLTLPAGVALGLNITGSLMCVMLTLIHAWKTENHQICALLEDVVDIEEEIRQKIQSFNLQDQDEPKNKLLYQEICHLQAKTFDEKALVCYQTNQLYRSMLIKMIVPVFVLLSLMFLPFTQAIMTVAFGLVLIGVLYGIARHMYPKPTPTIGLQYDVVVGDLQPGHCIALNYDTSKECWIGNYVDANMNKQSFSFSQDDQALNSLRTGTAKLTALQKQHVLHTALNNGYDFYFDTDKYNEYFKKLLSSDNEDESLRSDNSYP